MKHIIKKILKEQWDDGGREISPKELMKMWRFIDKLGINEALPHLGLESSEEEVDVITGYYKDYDAKWDIDIPIVFNASDVASKFSDRNYDLEDIVENYLNGTYEYDGYYDCFDYDHNWMWDDISEENKKFILGKAKEAGIDMDDEDYVIGFIEEEYGSDIGCAMADAQHSADVDELHKDIMDEVEELFSKFNGKWDFDKGEFVGTITLSQLSESEYFRDGISDHMDYNDTLDYGVAADWILREEWDRIGWASVFFDEEPNINTDKHFRYGGAGDMDKDYMNDILSDRLSYN